MQNINAMVSIHAAGPLNLFTVRKALEYLQREGVQRFNDGMYHVLINREGITKLLSGFSEHDASEAGFEVVNESPKRINFAGLRWEVSANVDDRVLIFGPKSSPVNTYLIEQSEGENHGVDNAGSQES